MSSFYHKKLKNNRNALIFYHAYNSRVGILRCAIYMTTQLHTVVYNTLDLTEFTRIMISRWITRQVSIELLITEAGGWLNKYATQQNGSKNRLNIG